MTQVTDKTYKTKAQPLSGTSYQNIAPQARNILRNIAARTKRRSYVRSAYFSKDKIFVTHFWQHLAQKSWSDRTRRLKYLPCAFDLIRNSKIEPLSKQNPNKSNEVLHRFLGEANEGLKFAVQIKEYKRTGRKELMSVFPYE